MHYYEVATAKIIRPTSTSYTYQSDVQLSVGTIVSVEVGKQHITGVVISRTLKPSYATKSIAAVLDDTPLPAPLLTLCLWLSAYYRTHLGLVLQSLLPTGITKKRRATLPASQAAARDRTQFVLNDDQKRALHTIASMQPGTALLHGVTGSGKTRIYIEAAQKVLREGKSVIVLVPEIALTAQLVAEFSQHFDKILLTHSRQSESERHKVWLEALHSPTPRLAIGPRSALFLPLQHVGLIVVDEAHEQSFKQEQSPRYSALRAASVLMTAQQGKVILGSATPLVADYYTAQQTNRPIITIANRANSRATLPAISLVDMTKKHTFRRHRFLSDPLLHEIEDALQLNKQILIFHNRRGSASTTLCENCGWQAMCPVCFIPLTLHSDLHHLRCHICGLTERVPTSCPVCHHADIIHKGIGTKLIESELRKLYPDKVIARFDGDNERTDSVENRYAELYSGDIDIIVGTQVIAKGLDLPNLKTVGVIQADSGLSLPDFMSSERTFDLLAQVIGRVGRSEHETSVVVQSYQPAHVAIQDGLAQDYAHFYAVTLQERKVANFPPFCYLLKLTCIYKSEASAIRASQALAVNLRAHLPSPEIQVLGPTPAFYERQGDNFKWQLTVKSPIRAHLVTLLDLLPTTHWQFELDPLSLL